jgi:hypothetical protein
MLDCCGSLTLNFVYFVILCVFQQQIRASPDVEIKWPVDEAACSREDLSLRDVDSVRVVPIHCLPYMKRRAVDSRESRDDTLNFADDGRTGKETLSKGNSSTVENEWTLYSIVTQ